MTMQAVTKNRNIIDVGIFNFVLIFMMQDSDIKWTCTVPFETSESLLLLTIFSFQSISSLSSSFCQTGEQYINAVKIAVRRNMKLKYKFRSCSSVKRRVNKVKISFSFLVVSSLIMVCCTVEPLFDLYLAINVHLKNQDVEIFIADNILEGIIWILTTLPYCMNTIVGVYFAPSRK